MTVRQLIDELQKIEDQDLIIVYEDNEYGIQQISEIAKHKNLNDNEKSIDYFYQLQ